MSNKVRRYVEIECADCKVKLQKRTDNKSKYCISCAHKKKPFESLYNSLNSDHRKLIVDITYSDFLEFTKIDKCHYCIANINWEEYSTINGKFSSRAYYLDRVDNDLGYLKTNLVVCCTRCNRARSNKFSYAEWWGMTSYFRDRK